jgi:hypothetical protein
VADRGTWRDRVDAKTSRCGRLGLVTWRLRLGSVLAAGKSVEVGRGTSYTILLGFVFLVVFVASTQKKRCGKEGLVLRTFVDKETVSMRLHALQTFGSLVLS